MYLFTSFFSPLLFVYLSCLSIYVCIFISLSISYILSHSLFISQLSSLSLPLSLDSLYLSIILFTSSSLSLSILSISQLSSLPSLFLDSLDLSILLFISPSLSFSHLSSLPPLPLSLSLKSPLCLFLYPSTFLCPTPTRQTFLCYPNQFTHSKPQRPDRPIAPQYSEPNISLCHPPNILHPLGRLLACSTFYYQHRTTPSLLIPLFSHPRPFSSSLHPHVCTSSNFSLNTYASVQVLRSTCCFKAATRSVEIVNLHEKKKTKKKKNK